MIRVGCVKGKGTATEGIPDAEEAILEGAEAAVAAEDDAAVETPEEVVCEAVEEAAEDTFDAAEEPEITEEEAVFAALPGGVFFAAAT